MYGLQLKNSKGSALLMVTVLGLVTGGILFYLFMDSELSYKNQKRLQDKTLYSYFIADIKKQLSWPDQCYIALKDQTYKLSSNNIVELKNFPYKNISKITKNLKIGSGLIISDIILRAKPFVELSKGELALNASIKNWARDISAQLTTRVAQLFIVVKSHLKYSFKAIPIDLFINTNSANKIQSCYTELSVAYTCENLKNAWNAKRSICEPYKQCFYSLLNTCSAPYSIVEVGVNGFYLCQWCNPNGP